MVLKEESGIRRTIWQDWPNLSSCFAGRNSEDCQQIDHLKHHKKAEKSPDKSFSCPRCGRKYKHTYSLTRHLRYECGNNPQFSCPVCQHKLYHRRYVEKHIRRKHPGYVLPFVIQWILIVRSFLCNEMIYLRRSKQQNL